MSRRSSSDGSDNQEERPSFADLLQQNIEPSSSSFRGGGGGMNLPNDVSQIEQPAPFGQDAFESSRGMVLPSAIEFRHVAVEQTPSFR